MAGLVHAQNDFQTDSLLVKASAKSGDTITKSITITSKVAGSYNLEVESLKGVEIKERTFTIEQNGEKTVEIIFNTKNIASGIYSGYINVRSETESSKVAVIFEVESEDVLFGANIDIPPAYKQIEQGSKLTYQIKIFDLNAPGLAISDVSPKSVDVTYSVISFDGKVLLNKDDQIIVDKQASLTNALDFPKNIEPGSYILGAVVKYKNSVGIASQTFEIVTPVVKENGQNIPDYAVIGAVIFALAIFFGTIVLFIYLLRERDKVLSQIKKYNENETRTVLRLLKQQKEVVKNKRDDIDLDEEIEKKLKELKEKQQQRIYEIKKLQSSGNTKEMEKKLRLWRSLGYNTSFMDYKIAGLSTSEMSHLLAKWKKKYSKKPKD